MPVSSADPRKTEEVRTGHGRIKIFVIVYSNKYFPQILHKPVLDLILMQYSSRESVKYLWRIQDDETGSLHEPGIILAEI